MPWQQELSGHHCALSSKYRDKGWWTSQHRREDPQWFLGYQKLCLNQNSEITFTNPMYPLLYFITRWELFRVLEKLFVAAFAEAPILKFENKTPHKLFFARNKTWHSHVVAP